MDAIVVISKATAAAATAAMINELAEINTIFRNISMTVLKPTYYLQIYREGLPLIMNTCSQDSSMYEEIERAACSFCFLLRLPVAVENISIISLLLPQKEIL